jgi:hypothetical protein
MSDMPAALASFQATYADLLAVLEDYPVGRRTRAGACGEWSPQQVLMHCSGWMVEALRRYDAYAAGTPGGVQYDFDTFNAQSVAARSTQTWETTVTELRELVDTLVQRVQGLPAAAVASEERYAGWLEALGEDCVDHTRQLRDFAEVQ